MLNAENSTGRLLRKALFAPFGASVCVFLLGIVRLLPPPLCAGTVGGYLLATFGLAFSLVLLLGAPIGVVLLLTSLFRRQRREATLLLGFVLILSSLGGYWAGIKGPYLVRELSMKRAAKRGQAIVDAIEAYRLVHRTYPDSLAHLQPKYIAQIPHTGICGYPAFEYSKIEKTGEFYYTGGYEIKIDTSLGALNWDVFVYWPSKNYPDRMYGGEVQRIGDWAYVHE